MHLLFDIGGTKTRIALSEDLKGFGEPVVCKTQDDFESGIKLFTETARKLIGEEDIKSVAGGIRGVLNEEKTEIASEVKLTDWVGKPLVERLRDEFSAPVFLENDSALVALGEVHHGAGKGFDIVAYITVSTGVGGARIVEGKIDEASVGFEPGKQIIDADQTLVPNTKGSTLEELISGTAVEKRFGKKAYDIPQEDSLWDELAEWLAAGLVNTNALWSPDAIILGGSMMVGDPNIPLTSVKKELEGKLSAYPRKPEIRLAELGNFGGLYGALEYIKQKSL